MTPVSPAFLFRFLPDLFFLLLVVLYLYLDGRNDECLFRFPHLQELLWQDVELMEGVVSVIRFPVALLNQFFASSTLSSSVLLNPWNFCIHAHRSLYSPESSTRAYSSSSGVLTP